MDKKAKNILFKTYWKNGWIESESRKISPSDLLYAKEKGLMFDPLTISHDECIEKIFHALAGIPEEKVSKAFLSSLSTRRLDWRSGLASFFIARHLIPHQYVQVEDVHLSDNGEVLYEDYICGVCRDLKYGITGNKEYPEEDLNVLNFERIKWGGVRHGDLIYTLFDLEQLKDADIPEPTVKDITILKSILSVIENSQPGDHPGILERNLKKVIPSSKDERQVLIEILACIEVLKPGSFDRKASARNDWVFVEFWRGEDKYNQEAVDKYFGSYLCESPAV